MSRQVTVISNPNAAESFDKPIQSEVGFCTFAFRSSIYDIDVIAQLIMVLSLYD